MRLSSNLLNIHPQQFHVETNHDYMMAKPTAPWFAALIWLELLFQVPFFAFATAGFVRQWNAVRIPCIIYGTSAFTSVVPILGDIMASEEVTDPQRYQLIFICEKLYEACVICFGLSTTLLCISVEANELIVDYNRFCALVTTSASKLFYFHLAAEEELCKNPLLHLLR